MYQLTTRDITYLHHLTFFSSSPSTGIREIDISDMEDSSAFVWSHNRPEGFYRSLSSLIETDISSIWPRFEVKSETFIATEALQEALPTDVEYDVTVHMPPKMRYPVELEIKSIRRGEPKIVVPEGIEVGL